MSKENTGFAVWLWPTRERYPSFHKLYPTFRGATGIERAQEKKNDGAYTVQLETGKIISHNRTCTAIQRTYKQGDLPISEDGKTAYLEYKQKQ